MKQKTLGKIYFLTRAHVKSFYKDPLQIKKKNSDDAEKKKINGQLFLKVQLQEQ